MRVVTERMKGRRVDTLDGIKIFADDGWAQILPDPAEPVVHVFAEGRTEKDARRLEDEFSALVEGIIADGGDDGGRPPGASKPSSGG